MKLKTLLKHELTVRDGIVLDTIHEKDGASPKYIVCDEISAPSLTQIADKLSAMGFIKRHKSRHDRRVVELRLTNAGKELINGH